MGFVIGVKLSIPISLFVYREDHNLFQSTSYTEGSQYVVDVVCMIKELLMKNIFTPVTLLKIRSRLW